MSEIKQTGIKISQYQTAELSNSKLVLEHYLLSYAPAYFGSSTINKNFKIPVSALREDIIGYIGVANAKSSWSNTLKIWSGEWNSTNQADSYVYTWSEQDKIDYKEDYIENKHGDETGVDKIFIINNAPLPQTPEESLDPNPLTKKIVTKSYIDNRFNGMPKIKCTSSTLEIHSYPCLYDFEMDSVSNINIVDTLVKNTIDNKCVEFMLRVPTSSLFYEVGDGLFEEGQDNTVNRKPPFTDFSVSANGTPCTWGYRNEILMTVSRAKNENTKDVWVRCFAEYIDGVFTVKCTNGLNVLEDEIITGAAGVVANIDETYNGKEVPTEEAVVNYVHLHTDKDDIHVTTSDKEIWNTTATNHIKDISITSNYLAKGTKENNVLELGLNTSDKIEDEIEDDDAATIPTTKAVIDYVSDVVEELSYDNTLNGITVSQTDGVVNLSVDVATLDENSKELDENTKDNVITGTTVKTLIDNEIKELQDEVIKKFAEVGVNYTIANDLPTPAEAKYKGWVYLIPKPTTKSTTNPAQNEYIEFICVNKDTDTWAWEQIGTTKADLTEYIQEETFNTKVGELQTQINNKISQVIQGSYITVTNYDTDKRIVSVDYSEKLSDDSETLPTTKAVYDVVNPHVTNDYIHLDEQIHNTIDDLVFYEKNNDFVIDLSDFFFKNINKEWVEKILILSAHTFTNEYNMEIAGDIDIPYCERIYTDLDNCYLKISQIEPSDNPNEPTLEYEGFELSDVAKSAIIEKVKLLAKIYRDNPSTGTYDPDTETFEYYITQLENSVPRKAKWIKDAKNGVCKCPLSFNGSTFRRNEIVRMIFWYLDQENGKAYGSLNSYSRKYMRPGLTVKCIVAPDNRIKPEKGTLTDQQYNEMYMTYTYIYFTFIGDKNAKGLPLINWRYKPSYLTHASAPGYRTHDENGDKLPNGHIYTIPDSFSNNWSYVANEQKVICLQQVVTELKNKKLDEVIEGDFISVENKNKVSVKTSDTLIDDATTVPTTKAVFDAINPIQNTSNISLTSFTHSFGYTTRDDNAKATGMIIKVPKTDRFNAMYIVAKGVEEDGNNIHTVDSFIWINLYEVTIENQTEISIKKIARSSGPKGMYSDFTQLTFLFDGFTLYEDKVYYCEFVELDDDGNEKPTRPIINIGLLNTESSLTHLQLESPLGIISSSQLNTFGKAFVGSYNACFMLAHRGNDVVHIRPTKNNVYSEKILLIKPSVVSSTDDVDYNLICTNHQYCIELNNGYFNTVNGDEYLVVKTFYVDTETNTSGELITHHQFYIS